MTQERMTPAQWRAATGQPAKPGDAEELGKQFADSMRRLVEAEKAPRAREEEQLQIQVVEWLNLALRKDVMFWHTPNGGQRDPRVAARLKAMGVQPGVADLGFFWSDRREGLRMAFLELKSKRGSLTPEQLDFRDWCLSNDIPWEQARTFEEAQASVKRWGLTDKVRRS